MVLVLGVHVWRRGTAACVPSSGFLCLCTGGHSLDPQAVGTSMQHAATQSCVRQGKPMAGRCYNQDVHIHTSLILAKGRKKGPYLAHRHHRPCAVLCARHTGQPCTSRTPSVTGGGAGCTLHGRSRLQHPCLLKPDPVMDALLGRTNSSYSYSCPQCSHHTLTTVCKETDVPSPAAHSVLTALMFTTQGQHHLAKP